ncbi:hypothetical protein JTE90_012624 [Oedothorax gibbosus]|uniref:Phosphotriesterase-related protein n=1 Tax=Oedothorax gibbosus TaxID=931172 RepID=A0AAV6ULU8_9ARAC|nr:hypothetical protein JTE90_012624 [Oedothorax gibbosus]
MKTIETVLGPIEPNQLGLTLTHEHLAHALKKDVFRKPKPNVLAHMQGEPLSLQNIGWVRQYPYSFDENNELNDEESRMAVKEEMYFFKKLGGGTIVDNGSVGLRASDQAQFLKTISNECGVNVVAGTGFYVSSSQSQSVLKMTVEEMTGKMREDLLIGMDGTNIKCGVMGEVGCSYPLEDFERRSLTATAIIQQETQAPVIVHPGRNKNAPEEILRVFQEAGGKVGHTVMSHLDRTIHSKEDLAEFASMGSFCEYDLFGVEVSHYQVNEEVDMLSDAQRINFLLHLVQEGYGDKIVISQDIHTKHRLMKFGGHGYSHIIHSIAPKMLKRGFTKENVNDILYVNPMKWLTNQ